MPLSTPFSGSSGLSVRRGLNRCGHAGLFWDHPATPRDPTAGCRGCGVCGLPWLRCLRGAVAAAFAATSLTTRGRGRKHRHHGTWLMARSRRARRVAAPDRRSADCHLSEFSDYSYCSDEKGGLGSAGVVQETSLQGRLTLSDTPSRDTATPTVAKHPFPGRTRLRTCQTSSRGCESGQTRQNA